MNGVVVVNVQFYVEEWRHGLRHVAWRVVLAGLAPLARLLALLAEMAHVLGGGLVLVLEAAMLLAGVAEVVEVLMIVKAEAGGEIVVHFICLLATERPLIARLSALPARLL